MAALRKEEVEEWHLEGWVCSMLLRSGLWLEEFRLMAKVRLTASVKDKGQHGGLAMLGCISAISFTLSSKQCGSRVWLQ